jgi:hypothetical protein
LAKASNLRSSFCGTEHDSIKARAAAEQVNKDVFIDPLSSINVNFEASAFAGTLYREHYLCAGLFEQVQVFDATALAAEYAPSHRLVAACYHARYR